MRLMPFWNSHPYTRVHRRDKTRANSILTTWECNGPHFAVYFLCILPALYRSYFKLKTSNKNQKIDHPFYSLFVRVRLPGNAHEFCCSRFFACNPQTLMNRPWSVTKYCPLYTVYGDGRDQHTNTHTYISPSGREGAGDEVRLHEDQIPPWKRMQTTCFDKHVTFLGS